MTFGAFLHLFLYIPRLILFLCSVAIFKFEKGELRRKVISRVFDSGEVNKTITQKIDLFNLLLMDLKKLDNFKDYSFYIIVQETTSENINFVNNKFYNHK